MAALEMQKRVDAARNSLDDSVAYNFGSDLRIESVRLWIWGNFHAERENSV